MSILPYTCVYIDAEWKDFAKSMVECFKCHKDRDSLIEDLEVMWKTPSNQHEVLPCLSVRTGLDLYLQVKAYPKGSEVIMSAINIPDMVQIVRHHGLKVVPLDVNIETTGPKVELLEPLINDNTVALLIAHIYGKWCNVNPLINVAKRKNLDVIEDCAEVFCGFERLGNPQSDIVLFSFGIIKHYTAFGGAILRIKDKYIFHSMRELYKHYPKQTQRQYLRKVANYATAYVLLDVPSIIKPLMYMTRTLNIDHKKLVIKMLRGFPEQLIDRIRLQPSNALLVTMKCRLSNFNLHDFSSSQIKAEYVRERLPEGVCFIGMQAEVNNYWLFPILVENADTMLKALNAMGIDAYRGATQLNIIEPEKWNQHLDYFAPLINYYPHEARYLLDHVLYLPVNKSVPFHALDQICKGVHLAMELCKNEYLPKVGLQSKL